MRNNRLKIILVSLFVVVSYASAVRPVTDLVKRILPDGYEREFVFTLCNDGSGKDFFELSSDKGKTMIKGNSPVSIASGLNWYLKYYCNCSLSFCEDQMDLPRELPLIDRPVKISAVVNNNFYMNYCTFSYTAAFWDWERWEREIDLMALNGITTPMAMVGVEAVWRNTLKRFGYSEAEIKDFLCGPAYTGWFLMANLEKHGGPLPDEWFDRQVSLQKKILKRMRGYGMKPIFQAFYGMVPNSLKSKYPEADIADQGEWIGFKRPAVLLPTDPLFEEMAEVWYDEYESLFGKTDFFAGDLFHEGGNTEGLDIAEIASGVQSAMVAYSPDAKWFIQAWGDNPKPGLLSGLDKKHTVIVDISAEYWTHWKDRKGFDGFPWIWSHVTNYGGNIGLHGRLDAIASGPLDAMKDPFASKCMYGIGAAPEGIEVNPVAFDLANEMRWRNDSVDMDDWIRKYSNRRYGDEDEVLEKAWCIFYKTAYGTYEGHRRPSESVFCAKPSLKGIRITASAWSQCKTFYDTNLYAEGVKVFLSRSEKYRDKETYKYDVVDFVRQYLSDFGRSTYYDIVKAYKDGNKQLFEEKRKLFLDIILDQDKLLSSHPAFNVGKWLEQARAASSVKEYQDLYEFNARQLVGTWSSGNTALRDYAHREWGGMLRDYYYPRWDAYLEYLGEMLSGKDVDEPDLFPLERKWIGLHNEYRVQDADVISVAKSVFEKYNEGK